MRVLVAEPIQFTEDALLALQAFSEVHLKVIESEQLADALNTYDILWFRLKFKITRDLILQSCRCRFIVCPVTGLDHIDLEACNRAGIEVLSLKGETDFLQSVRATAELTMGLTFALLRKIPQSVQSTLHGVWERDQFRGTEILKKKVGIIGVGRLGRIVSGYFKAFGAEVYGFDKVDFDSSICTPVKCIEELVTVADIISIHLSYQQDTHHFINDRLLAMMKPTAFLINTARGGVVDSKALIDALKNNRLAGAAVDVIENEYNINESQLMDYARKYQNLLITPHIGGNTYESFLKTELFMVDKLRKRLHESN